MQNLVTTRLQVWLNGVSHFFLPFGLQSIEYFILKKHKFGPVTTIGYHQNADHSFGQVWVNVLLTRQGGSKPQNEKDRHSISVLWLFVLHCSWGNMSKCVFTPDRKAITNQSNIITKVYLGETISLVNLFIGIWARQYLQHVHNLAVTVSPKVHSSMRDEYLNNL